MTDIKNFFSKDKSVYNEPKEDFYMQSTLIHIAEAFSRITYKSIFLLDYYKQEFLYVSNNPLFLCGHTAKEVKNLGYSFFLEHVPEEEREMLIELNSRSLKTIFQHKACTDKLYADSFYKVQKNSYSSFEVICCRG